MWPSAAASRFNVLPIQKWYFLSFIVRSGYFNLALQLNLMKYLKSDLTFPECKTLNLLKKMLYRSLETLDLILT